MSWRLKRARRRLAKREQRLKLLLLATDRQHLLVKEATKLVDLRVQQRYEQTESLLHRTTGSLPLPLTPGRPMELTEAELEIFHQSGLLPQPTSPPSSES